MTYNSGEVTLTCLEKLQTAITDDYEIIMVDNNSTDGIIDLVRERFPRVQIMVNPQNCGFAAANNLGIRAARGAYIVLLNPDVYVEPDTFQVLLAYLQTAPDVGLVGPKTFTTTGKVDLSAHSKLTVPTILWQFWGLDRLFPYAMIGHYLRQSETATEPFPVDWLQGHCLMFAAPCMSKSAGWMRGYFCTTKSRIL